MWYCFTVRYSYATYFELCVLRCKCWVVLSSFHFVVAAGMVFYFIFIYIFFPLSVVQFLKVLYLMKLLLTHFGAANCTKFGLDYSVPINAFISLINVERDANFFFYKHNVQKKSFSDNLAIIWQVKCLITFIYILWKVRCENVGLWWWFFLSFS